MATSARERSSSSRARIGRSSQHGAAAGDRPVQRADARVEDHADARLAVDLDGDRGRVGRVAVDVVGGAVERVDDPAHPARALSRLPSSASRASPGRSARSRSTMSRSASLSTWLTTSVGDDLVSMVRAVAAVPRVDAPRLQREVARQGEQLAQVGRCGGEGVAVGGHVGSSCGRGRAAQARCRRRRR